ncbi:hypothetical protein GCM10020229_09610 [Kitasatospora albolonga]
MEAAAIGTATAVTASEHDAMDRAIFLVIFCHLRKGQMICRFQMYNQIPGDAILNSRGDKASNGERRPSDSQVAQPAGGRGAA